MSQTESRIVVGAKLITHVSPTMFFSATSFASVLVAVENSFAVKRKSAKETKFERMRDLSSNRRKNMREMCECIYFYNIFESVRSQNDRNLITRHAFRCVSV